MNLSKIPVRALAAITLMICPGLAEPILASSTTVQFDVNVRSAWRNTGVDIETNQRLQLTTDPGNTVNYGPLLDIQLVNADGVGPEFDGSQFRSDTVLPDTIVLSLIGRIGETLLPEVIAGNGEGFVGTSYDQVVQTSGRLYLGFNDREGFFPDNSGAFSVTITVTDAPILDADDDGFEDAVDNCPEVYNPEQGDNDNDGEGDVCDSDDDNDGSCDAATPVAGVCFSGPDNCPLIANPGQADLDLDGVGDACDSTLDPGGVTQAIEDYAGESSEILAEASPPGVNGMIKKLVGNGSVTKKVVDAVTGYDASLLDANDYLVKLGDAMDQLTGYESQLGQKIDQGKVDAATGAALLAAAADIRTSIQALVDSA